MDTETPVAGAPPLADVVQSIAPVKGSRKSDWSHTHIAMLRAHHADGLSCSDSAALINERYGTDYTRCAVIGKRHRLGLRGGGDAPTRSAPAKTVRGEKPVVLAAARPARPQPPKPRFKHEPGGMRTVATAFRHLDLLELKAGECKWPSAGDAPFTFCGCAVFNNINALPYCAPHYALATRPSSYDCKEARR